MPYFIDRHEICDSITPAQAALYNLEDLKTQQQFNCRKISYWFDDIRKIAFCLFEAPDKESLMALHKHVHHNVKNQIIEIESNVIDSFLKQLKRFPNINKLELPVALPTFLACDLSLNQLNNNHTRLKVIHKKYLATTNEAINNLGGNIISQIGTFFLVAFQSGPTAINCALKMRKKFYAKNKAHKNNHHLKIGVCGEIPGEKANDNIKASVKLAKRLCYIAKDKILLTLEVKNLFLSENSKILVKGNRMKSVSPDDISFITTLLDYMERNWKNPELHASDFETHLACSKSQIYRKMIALIDQSPNAFIKEYRLNRAIEMLRQRKGNISEVAFDAGFGSPSYFSKCFQKEYRIKPSEYLSELSHL